jgi:hypothetical protein
MMGQQDRSERLFYYFRLADQYPYGVAAGDMNGGRRLSNIAAIIPPNLQDSNTSCQPCCPRFTCVLLMSSLNLVYSLSRYILDPPSIPKSTEQRPLPLGCTYILVHT